MIPQGKSGIALDCDGVGMRVITKFGICAVALIGSTRAAVRRNLLHSAFLRAIDP